MLTKDIEKRLKELVKEIAEEKGFEVSQIEIGEQDHVHIFVSAPPKLSPSLIVKYIKGITARKLFKEFPELKAKLAKGHLWNPSYYIETVGSISEDIIKKYIENQMKGL